MPVLFDSVSRKSNRGLRVRILLIFVIAITFVMLDRPTPTRGVAPQACGDLVTFYSSVITDYPSAECDTAKNKARQKALLDVATQRINYVCPAACPNLVEVLPPPHITCGPECPDFQLPNGARRYDGVADAVGTYRCVP